MSRLLNNHPKVIIQEMTLRIQKLIQTLTETFEGTPWFGDSVLLKLKAIDYQLVNKKLANSNNSIAILLQHLINWRVFAIEKLEGNQGFDIELNSDKDWTNITIKSKEEWEELLYQLTSTQQTIIRILEQQQEDSFLDQMTSGKTYSFGYLIEGVIQHDLYHLGQIGLLDAYWKLNN